jgi:hypothetical protein
MTQHYVPPTVRSAPGCPFISLIHSTLSSPSLSPLDGARNWSASTVCAGRNAPSQLPCLYSITPSSRGSTNKPSSPIPALPLWWPSFTELWLGGRGPLPLRPTQRSQLPVPGETEAPSCGLHLPGRTICTVVSALVPPPNSHAPFSNLLCSGEVPTLSMCCFQLLHCKSHMLTAPPPHTHTSLASIHDNSKQFVADNKIEFHHAGVWNSAILPLLPTRAA